MKHLQSFYVLLFVLLFAGTGFSQLKFGGRVVDVIDGKTVVIEMESGRLTAVLQYIETPEPEQPLFQTVKDHLGRLVLGQYVDFQPKGIMPTKTLGTMYLKGLDIAQQMVRDGAAWHIPAEKSGQNPQDGELYRSNELQAKTERRGVWSIQNLKPAWEFRAAKNEHEQQKKIDEWNVYLENSAANRPTTVSRTRRQTAEERMRANENVGIWPELSSDTAEASSGFIAGYNRDRKEGYTATPGTLLDLAGTSGQRFGQKVEFRAIYVYRGDPNKINESSFIFGIMSNSAEQKFLSSNTLIITADRQTIDLGTAKRLSRPVADGYQELLLYNVDAKAIKQIAAAKKLSVKLGRYVGPMTAAQDSIKQLLDMSN